MKSVTLLYGMKLLLLMALLCASPVTAAKENLRGYVMIVYSDRAQGEFVLEGNHEKAISTLLRREDGSPAGFADQVNLCVAFTKTRQLEKATRFCDLAVARSDRQARRLVTNYALGQHARQVAATDRAIALTNRGVLHAIAGETDAAKDLFEEAQDVKVIGTHAHNNLARLQTTSGNSSF